MRNPFSFLVVGTAFLVLGLPWSACGQQGSVGASGPIAYDASRLRSYSDDELVGFLTQSSQFYNATRGTRFVSAVALELVRRRPYGLLLERLESSTDGAQRSWIERVLSRIRAPVADSGLRVLSSHDRDERSYFALKYFARVGDRWALKILDENYGSYPVPASEWGEVVGLFGHFRYCPAAKHLAESIGGTPDAGIVAIRALIELYPEGRGRFDTDSQARGYWANYVDSYHCK